MSWLSDRFKWVGDTSGNAWNGVTTAASNTANDWQKKQEADKILKDNRAANDKTIADQKAGDNETWRNEQIDKAKKWAAPVLNPMGNAWNAVGHDFNEMGKEAKALVPKDIKDGIKSAFVKTEEATRPASAVAAPVNPDDKKAQEGDVSPDHKWFAKNREAKAKAGTEKGKDKEAQKPETFPTDILLVKGKTGQAEESVVNKLRIFLNVKGSEEGSYDGAMVKAVTAFQEMHNSLYPDNPMPVDGKAGPLTMAAINANITKEGTFAVSSTTGVAVPVGGSAKPVVSGVTP